MYPRPMRDDESLLSRRSALATLGALGAAPLAGCVTPTGGAPPTGTSNDDDASSDDDDATPDCVVTPYQTEGPFWFDAGLVRTEINEGKPGVTLGIALRVIDAATCEPIPDAVVDLWHCDGSGWYSGYPNQGDNQDVDTSGQTFCRGIQVTDSKGRVTFTTIVPGWYPGRAVHVHAKVFLDGTSYVTTQLYFPDAIIDEAHANNAPYVDRGARDTRNDGGGGRNTGCTCDSASAEGSGLAGLLLLSVAALRRRSRPSRF